MSSRREGPETKLKKEFRDFMESIGAYRVTIVPMGFGKSYVDDFFCLKGRFIAAEGKAPGKYKTPWDGCTVPQKRCLQDVNQAGGFAFAYDNLETARKLILHMVAG
jgi:hypothetical protein